MIVDVYQYFKQHPKFNKKIGNNFLLVEYQCPINSDEFQLWTESHLITFVINGQKDWFTKDHTYCLKSGDALFVKKGVYTTKQYFEQDYCVMLFFMNDDFIKDFVHNHNWMNSDLETNKPSESVIKIDTDKSFNTLVESIFQYLTMEETIPDELVEIKFKELVFNIALNKKNIGFKNLLLDISKSSKVRLEQVMNRNFQYDLPLLAFARLSGRSLSSFKRDFKEHFSLTPSKWLINRRLEYSKTLLKSTSLNINEVCFESGFKNSSHFIRAFKHAYQQTPVQFRRSLSV
jgi:AraC-like DNA-binding protein